MMMTGGEGCGGNDPDPNKPSHCPGQTEHEYRTEGATYSISASPMMVGTDIRLMTPVMEQVRLWDFRFGVCGREGVGICGLGVS